MEQTTAIDAAMYLLTLDDASAGDLMSNLKLQKLLYYAQGVCLAVHNEPLFPERIDAWRHGPVCKKVFHLYKKFGSDAIPPPEFDPSSVPEEAASILREVHTVYGQFSAWRLREMTHSEPPWRDNYRDGVSDIEIPHADLRRYFLTVLASG